MPYELKIGEKAWNKEKDYLKRKKKLWRKWAQPLQPALSNCADALHNSSWSAAAQNRKGGFSTVPVTQLLPYRAEHLLEFGSGRDSYCDRKLVFQGIEVLFVNNS